MNEKESDSPDLETQKAQAMQQVLFRNALMVTKHGNELPSNTETGYWEYCQTFPQFSNIMKQYGDRITQVMTKIYNHYGLTGRVGKLDLEEQLELVSDCNDVLMERISLTLDEAAGLKKQAETVVVEMMAKTNNLNGSWNRHSANSPSTSYRLLSAKNILRPQLKFKGKIVNKPVAFVPKIKEKPHSMKPLAILLELNDYNEEEFSHPYEFELENFSPDKRFFRVDDQISPFRPVAETQLVMVDNEASLKKLMEDLVTQNEIAVDLEAHSYRTFQGLTCLMQISTTNADYIVDTLELWDNLSCLNEVFCNPNIVKIFHGADGDVEWLQRDFGLYIVNLFDTYQAAKLLNFPHLSLAYLLRHYCQINVNKEFQLADWRIRPIPEEMINYAREDTHYLHFVYQKLKTDLMAKGVGDNLLTATWNNSRQTCLKKYKIPSIGADSHMDIYRKSKMMFNDRQLFAFKEIFHWRDKVARMEDESLGFVLPKHMMLQIAKTLPKEMQGILACCSPIPSLVRQHLLVLHQIILKAREMPLVSPKNPGEPLVAEKPMLSVEQDMEDPLYCVHDLSHMQDIRDDLPTLISSESSYVPQPRKEDFSIRIGLKAQPGVRIFASAAVADVPVGAAHLPVAFTTPYMRFTQAREAIKNLKKAEEEEAESDGRIEKIRQLFVDTVADTVTETVTETAPVSEEPIKKKQKLPLSAQIPKIKRKRSKKNVKTVDPVPPAEPDQDAEAYSAAADAHAVEAAEKVHDPADYLELSMEAQGPTKKKRRKQMMDDKKAEKMANFKAFDYSQVDYQPFQRNAPKNANMKSKRAQKGDRSRMNRKRGQKSMTYSTKQQ